MYEENENPFTRQEMQRRWQSSTPRERREMMKRVREYESRAEEGIARDRKTKRVFRGVVGFVLFAAVAIYLSEHM